MSLLDLHGNDLWTLGDMLRRREVSAEELVTASLARITATNPEINAFVAINPDLALNEARASDRQRASGADMGPLAGLGLAVKDNLLTEGFATTASSAVTMPLSVRKDAEAVARLRAAGMIVLGKTNMHEWAYGATTTTSHFGPARNPWNLGHMTGGSSGGSAAAVASGQVAVALGTDTGGSVRIPAAACGICALKPSYGAVPTEGVLPLSVSLDSVGPMARSVRDLRLLYRALAGQDASLTKWIHVPRPLRLGLARGARFAMMPEVEAVFQEAIGRFDAQALVPVDLSEIEAAFDAWRTILRAEASTFHAPMLVAQPEAYSAEVRAKLQAGLSISAVDYLTAQNEKAAFAQLLERRLRGLDALVLPTLPILAPLIDKIDVSVGDVRLSVGDAMMRTAWLANLSGFPAVTMPCGVTSGGLPVGLTLLGAAGSDDALLAVAQACEQRLASPTGDWMTSAAKRRAL